MWKLVLYQKTLASDKKFIHYAYKSYVKKNEAFLPSKERTGKTGRQYNGDDF